MQNYNAFTKTKKIDAQFTRVDFATNLFSHSPQLAVGDIAAEETAVERHHIAKGVRLCPTRP